MWLESPNDVSKACEIFLTLYFFVFFRSIFFLFLKARNWGYVKGSLNYATILDWTKFIFVRMREIQIKYENTIKNSLGQFCSKFDLCSICWHFEIMFLRFDQKDNSMILNSHRHSHTYTQTCTHQSNSSIQFALFWISAKKNSSQFVISQFIYFKLRLWHLLEPFRHSACLLCLFK